MSGWRGQAAVHPVRRNASVQHDFWLLGLALALLGLGLVMVASASMSLADSRQGQPLYFLWRQLAHAAIGMLAGWVVYRTPVAFWERHGGSLLLIGYLLLALVLVPGIGREVNGAMRWLNLGVMTLQPSELMKLLAVIFIAGYMVRRRHEVQGALWGFVKPMLLLGFGSVLLLMEPDFGAAVVIMATATAMLFLGGVRLVPFFFAGGAIAGLATTLVLTSPYRMQRLTTFVDPWADPFDSGFQLTQALIAFGRGDWFGVGLGASIQKLSYLPEAHTDFIIAVLAEELGMVGLLIVITLYGLLLLRGFQIGARAERAGQAFAAHLAYGLSIWLSLQVFISIGVNMGLLPTKGLTLPLMSYGGSSLLVTCLALALLLRIAYECESPEFGRRLDDAGVRYPVEVRA
ncbi:MAG: putative lipid II flippase FtsW [Gammaproteobacteria bacterium]|nr:MAG: putative lipid II flippase FtsW [Gammaproteobacteria bacterium]